MLAGERFAGGSDSVELVRLGAVTACRTLGAVDLDDPFGMLKEIGSQPGAEATGAFDRPDAATRSQLIRERQQAPIASCIGGDRQVSDQTSRWCDGRRGVRVLVGIDAQDEVDPISEHGQGQSSARRNPGFGHWTAARQDCDGSRSRADRLLIRPASHDPSGR